MKGKRITAGLLAAVMALGLVSCGDTDKSSKESPSVSQSVSKGSDTELAKKFIGMDAEKAKELLSDTYGHAEDNQITGGYTFIGDAEFLGQGVHCIYLITDNGSGKVSGFGVKADYIGERIDTAFVYEAGEKKKKSEAFLKELTDRYGSPKSVLLGVGRVYQEYEWPDEKIRLEYSYNEKNDDGGAFSQVIIEFGETRACRDVAPEAWE